MTGLVPAILVFRSQAPTMAAIAYLCILTYEVHEMLGTLGRPI